MCRSPGIAHLQVRESSSSRTNPHLFRSGPMAPLAPTMPCGDLCRGWGRGQEVMSLLVYENCSKTDGFALFVADFSGINEAQQDGIPTARGVFAPPWRHCVRLGSWTWKRYPNLSCRELVFVGFPRQWLFKVYMYLNVWMSQTLRHPWHDTGCLKAPSIVLSLSIYIWYFVQAPPQKKRRNALQKASKWHRSDKQKLFTFSGRWQWECVCFFF